MAFVTVHWGAIDLENLFEVNLNEFAVRDGANLKVKPLASRGLTSKSAIFNLPASGYWHLICIFLFTFVII